jgi:hypothetical protein
MSELNELNEKSTSLSAIASIKASANTVAISSGVLTVFGVTLENWLVILSCVWTVLMILKLLIDLIKPYWRKK